MWEFYLAGGVVAFESGSMCNYQLQYVRDRYALPITRDYMLDKELEYRAAGKERAQRKSPGPRRARAKETV
jgi:cyclopropane-fatty-acyl-phospholipid synthase